MDTEEESAAYLKLFNEGPHNYLMHNTEDTLNDAFPVESIFTEIAADWTSETLPILLSGPLTVEDNSESTNTNFQLLSQENVNSPPNDADRLFISNDVLLRLNGEENESQGNRVTHVINGDSITYTQEEAVESEENVEVIQLLNIDGTVTTINKNLLNAEGKEKLNFENYYTQVQANKCKLCSFLCESAEDITAHINIKHGKELQQHGGLAVNNGEVTGTKMTSILNVNNRKKYTLYICSDCGNGYSNKEDLRQHMINQHKMVETSTSSPAAPDKTPPDKPKPSEKEQKHSARATSTSLVKKQKALRKVKCSIKGCPLRFEKDDLRKRHEACHVDQNKKQFMCPVCKVKFSIWRICSMHMWKCHSIDLGLLTCPMCRNFKSYSSVRVINHMAIHNEEKPFICTACGKAFKQLNQLTNHEVVHRAAEDIPNSLTSKQCELCNLYFANSKSLKKHIKSVHDKFKPFICNICGHQTTRKEMLQLHYRQHTGDKPFHCSYCDFKTGDPNCLRKHTMRHFGAAKYSCPYCDYHAIQASAYKVHLANKHPGKEGTYACTLCRYTTINCRSYLSHVKGHELEKKKKVNGKVEKRTNIEDNESKSSDETHNFLNTDHSEEAVDTGGITIPASFDLQLVNEQTSLI